jgi:hypothetical protein
MSEGYLYLAKGKKHIREAIASAKSLRRVDYKAHITLIADEGTESTIFDKVVIKSSNNLSWKEGLLYKMKNIYNESPYEKTFFIDTDTFFCERCRELFDILDYYDVCISHAPIDAELVKLPEKDLAGYFPYNTGVILFRKNDNNKKLFFDCYNIFKKNYEKYRTDQVAFMHALLYSKSRVYVLQNIYNARIPFYISIMGKPVKIIHGRIPNYEKVKLKINSARGNRGWDPHNGNVYYKKIKKNVYYQKIRMVLRETFRVFPILRTFKAIVKKQRG